MRIRELQKYQEKKRIHTSIIFFDDPNFTYFTGLRDVHAILIVPTKKRPFVLISSLEKSIAKKHSLVRKIIPIDNKPLKFIPKNKRIGVNKQYISMKTMENLRKKRKVNFIDIEQELIKLRSIKTKKEIQHLKKSCKIASEIMNLAIKKASKKITESQLKKLIDIEILKRGLTPSFPAIIASGKNSSNPHHIPENKKLKGFVIIDLGVKYKNYCSDMSRTIYIGNPSKKELKDYEKVLKTQQESLKLNTNKASSLFSKAKKSLGKHFTHSLGHGTGIEIHESPFLGKTKDIIKNNMIFTIEPGLYKKNYGIRIEDTILYTNNKVFILTKLDKKLKIKR